MDEKLLDYLETLGATSPVVEGVKQAVDWYAKMGMPWREAFISETVNDAGQREWGSLWLLRDDCAMEVRDFVTTQDYDVAVMNTLTYLRCQTKDFDWSQASVNSRAYVRFDIATGISGEMRASGKNCDNLAAIVRDYLKPLLVSRP